MGRSKVLEVRMLFIGNVSHRYRASVPPMTENRQTDVAVRVFEFINGIALLSNTEAEVVFPTGAFCLTARQKQTLVFQQEN